MSILPVKETKILYTVAATNGHTRVIEESFLYSSEDEANQQVARAAEHNLAYSIKKLLEIVNANKLRVKNNQNSAITSLESIASSLETLHKNIFIMVVDAESEVESEQLDSTQSMASTTISW